MLVFVLPRIHVWFYKTWLVWNQCVDFQEIANLGRQACLRRYHMGSSCFWPIWKLVFVSFQFYWYFAWYKDSILMRHIQPVVALGFYMLILLLAHFGFFTFLFTNPSVLFAFPIMLLMWLFQFRSWDMVTPRYLALSTLSRTWPWSVYWDWSGCFDLVIWSTWHLPGLNSISQVRSHSCRVSRSAWRMFTSLNELTVK